ncbi:MAG: hypothetical protein WCD04_00020 [Terriglobia bacterium]|jgi:hypothetical protein
MDQTSSQRKRLHELVKEFLSKVPSITQPQFHEFDIKQVYPDHNDDPWRIKPGVYYFSLDDDIKYVGKGSSEWGLGYRVYRGLNKVGLKTFNPPDPKPKWSDMLNDPGSRVGIFEFDPSDFYWPVSLEALLIRRLNPVLNKIGKAR